MVSLQLIKNESFPFLEFQREINTTLRKVLSSENHIIYQENSSQIITSLDKYTENHVMIDSNYTAVKYFPFSRRASPFLHSGYMNKRIVLFDWLSRRSLHRNIM